MKSAGLTHDIRHEEGFLSLDRAMLAACETSALELIALRRWETELVGL